MMKKIIQSKEEAIETVKNGNKVYYLECLGFAREWVKIQFKPFTSEDLKRAYFDLGNDPPNESRVFGAIFKTLSDEKLILYYDFVKAKNKVAHGRDLKRWISKTYSIKQAQNASRKETTLDLFKDS